MSCLKKIMSVLLVMCTLGFILVIPTYADSEWPTLSSDAYLEMVSPMSAPVYEDRNLKTRGTFLPRNNPDASISPGDELTIIAITSTYTRVMYKSASRNCVGFVDTYTLLGTTSPKEIVQSKAKVNTYLGSSTNNRSGSTSIGDTVYKLGATKNGYVMIIYTAKSDSRAYKCAFVSKNDYALITGDNGTTSSSDMVDVTSEFAGRTISLKSIENGKYLCADSSYSEIPAICNRDSVGDWEKFTVSSITSDGWIGLKAVTNGKYLSAIIDSQDAPIRASASDLYSWECFRIFRKGSDYFLKAQANDKWLCVRVDLSNSPVQAYADTPLTWERFAIREETEPQPVAPEPSFYWPCESAYKVSCLYYYKNGGKHSCKWNFHNGIDISGGGKVLAVASGTVASVINKGNESFGLYIIITHDNGEQSLYAHLKSVSVNAGDHVDGGQKIGVMGNSGNVKGTNGGTHLHFEYSGGDLFDSYFKEAYAYDLSFEQNVYSNNKAHNSDKSIVTWLDNYYIKKNGYYYHK